MIDFQIPNLRTEPLILPDPKAKGFENVVAFFGDKECSWGFGAPLDRSEAWRWFALMIGQWGLLGFWPVETVDRQPVGMVGIWNPEGWPEPKLGWVMFAGSEGRGYADEAAKEARRYTYNVPGIEPLNSNIFPGNDCSNALAERSGARYERSYENVSHSTDLVYRRPGPDQTIGAIR